MSSHVMQCNVMVWYGMAWYVCICGLMCVCVQIHIEHAVMLDQLRFYHSRAAQQLIQDIMDGRVPREHSPIWMIVCRRSGNIRVLRLDSYMWVVF